MKLNKQDGFTLIEVMVALTIMAVLAVLTSQAMKSAVDNRVALSAEISRDQRLADTLRLMRSDIANAFHYRDLNIQMLNEILKPTPDPNAANSGQPGGFGAPPAGGAPAAPVTASALGTPRPTPIQVTNFVGDTNSLYLTTTTNMRTIKDTQESDLAKIGYFTKSCKSPGERGGNSNCLYRSTSPFLDDDVTKGGNELMLAEHVEEFKLRYLGPDHDDYMPQWKTDKNGDDSTKDIFPYAVEITLTLYDKTNKKDKPVTGTILAPINFPNNLKKKKNSSTTETDVTQKK